MKFDMKKILSIVSKQIFPSLDCSKANKSLKKKAESNESRSNISFKGNVDKIPIESFRKKYSDTFETKDKFEDKAKTNVIGITIAITLIMGASNMITSIVNKYTSDFMHWISYFIMIAAALYLLSAGIQAIKVLFTENTMYFVEVLDMYEDNEETKEKYDDCANRNIDRNIIRNNIVFLSYICIRNALICMVLLLIFIAIPVNFKEDKIQRNIEVNNSYISYNSDIAFPEGYDVLKLNKIVMQDKESRELLENGDLYSFVNATEKMFIQYRCFGSNIIVEKLCFFENIQEE